MKTESLPETNPEPLESPELTANKTSRPNQTTNKTKTYGFNGVEDSTLQPQLQVGGLGDAIRVELKASPPCP